MKIQQKITPFIWYQQGAEDAVAHYLKVFGSGQVTHTQRWGENSPGEAGSVMVVQFELLGQQMTAFNGGPHFKLTEAFSLMVACTDQAEIDHLWTQLQAGGGREKACGWVEDALGPVLADHPGVVVRHDPRPRPGARAARVPGDLGHGQDRPGGPAESLRGSLSR